MMLLIRSLGSGGAERVCVTLANAFAESGEAVELLLLQPGGDSLRASLSAKVKVTVLGTAHARSAAVKLGRHLLKARPESILVFNHQLTVLLVCLRVLLRMDFRIIARNISNLSEKAALETSPWHRIAVPFAVRRLYGKADVVICQSRGMGRDLVENFRVPPGKVKVINNPVAPEFEDGASPPIPRAGSGADILFVGRLEPVKGLGYLLDAFALVAARNREARLVLVGEGSLRQELEDRAGGMGLGPRVVFKGFRSDVRGYYLSSRMTVLTSHFEGFPNVLVESISLGTPVVSFDCPSGPMEIVEDGVNGYLVPPGDVAALAEKILLVLAGGIDPARVKASAEKFRAANIIPRYAEILLAP